MKHEIAVKAYRNMKIIYDLISNFARQENISFEDAYKIILEEGKEEYGE